MSQVALGFACSEAEMAQANQFCKAGDTARMMATLRRRDVGAFGWSGYVIVVLAEWLTARGIGLPRASTPATADLIARTDPMLCATQAQARSLAAALRALAPTDEDLARHWSAFTGEDPPEARQFMAAGLAWLTRLAEAGAANDWCLLLEG